MGSKIDLPIVRLFSSEQENQLKLMFFRKLHQYIVCSLSVCLHWQKRLPLASVVRRLYGWLDAACVYEFNAHSREKRIGLFSLPQHAEQVAFRKSADCPGSAENILTIIPCLPYNET